MITYPINRVGGLAGLWISEHHKRRHAIAFLASRNYRVIMETEEHWNALQHLWSWLVFVCLLGTYRPRPGWILTAEPVIRGGQWQQI